jgi:hypothetical protein
VALEAAPASLDFGEVTGGGGYVDSNAISSFVVGTGPAAQGHGSVSITWDVANSAQ